ncbi:hypothetical protein [Loktanella sp. 3ANDIMAR09]|uniref:hypothetical protein n=1 Tax=Loktanella sp. 3ANDIMAR09 TaxID=1225657 RepID=UPI0006FF46A9|nr:hypothetical protein [Loktanella sp. 3ANDIMAR09]
MTDRPIPFSPDMMRAVLREIAAPGTGKTQTRRVLKPQPEPGGEARLWTPPNPSMLCVQIDKRHIHGSTVAITVPAPSDRLWVREAWRTTTFYDDQPPRDMGSETPIRYECDGAWETWGWKRDHNEGRYRPPMFMPRWASRVTLTVTDVKVQRVQDISEADAWAEGVHRQPFDTGTEMFRTLWDSLNDKRGFGWDVNPWVVAVTFRPVAGNIDQIGEAA